MDTFWHNLLPFKQGNFSFENKSLDVSIKGCFDFFDPTACARCSLLFVSGIFTILMCLIRIYKLHYFHHPQIHQYLIFYFASFEITCLVVKWFTMSYLYQMEFAASYLKVLQFILLCHFHWSLVSRILHQQRILNWIIIPLLAFFFIFYTTITVFALMSNYSPWIECLAPHWLVLSFAEFLLMQLYVVAGFYITQKINSVSSIDSFKWEQKRDLWSVILTYVCSSAAALIYYIILQLMGDQKDGCSGLFGHTQATYSLVYTTFMILKYLLPIWVMLLIFYPIRGCLTREDERLLGWSTDGSTTSVFSSGARFQESYKQLILPAQGGMFPESPAILRRTASSPALFVPKSLPRVPEEGPVLPPARINYPQYGATGSLHSQPGGSGTHRSRSRHDSGAPHKHRKAGRMNVSLNQCSSEAESITPSSVERY